MWPSYVHLCLKIASLGSDGDFGHRDSRSGVPEAVEDAVDVAEVFPHKAADAHIHGDGLKSPARGFIARGGAADGSIVNEWSHNLWDFRLEDEGNVTMKYGDCVSGSLQENSTPKHTERRLKTGEVAQSNIKHMVIVSDK